MCICVCVCLCVGVGVCVCVCGEEGKKARNQERNGARKMVPPTKLLEIPHLQHGYSEAMSRNVQYPIFDHNLT